MELDKSRHERTSEIVLHDCASVFVCSEKLQKNERNMTLVNHRGNYKMKSVINSSECQSLVAFFVYSNVFLVSKYIVFLVPTKTVTDRKSVV